MLFRRNALAASSSAGTPYMISGQIIQGRVDADLWRVSAFGSLVLLSVLFLYCWLSTYKLVDFCPTAQQAFVAT